MVPTISCWVSLVAAAQGGATLHGEQKVLLSGRWLWSVMV